MLEVEKIEEEVINTNPAQYAFKVENGTDDFGTKIYRKEVTTVEELHRQTLSCDMQIDAIKAQKDVIQGKLDAIADLEA